MPTLEPSRVSSEAPEVVPGQFLNATAGSPNPTSPSLSTSPSQLSTPFKGRHSPAQSWLSSISDRKGTRDLTAKPQIIHDDAVPYQPKEVRSRRVFSLVTTIVLVVIGFCFGGGIGGGIASAVTMSHRTSSSAPSPPSTVIVDTAGCPLVNNSSYISQGGVSFLAICSTSILPQSGQFIDLSNSMQPSFDSCLDACGAATGCLGATWYMFDPTTPSRNSGCFLKNGTGEGVVASGSLSVVSGYRQTALPS